MVDSAQAGVEIIKHQTHVVEDEMCGAAKNIIPETLMFPFRYGTLFSFRV